MRPLSAPVCSLPTAIRASPSAAQITEVLDIPSITIRLDRAAESSNTTMVAMVNLVTGVTVVTSVIDVSLIDVIRLAGSNCRNPFTLLEENSMKSGNRLIATALAAGSALALSVAAGSAMAQAFPNAPIKFVIPFPAGSGSDLVHRPIAEHMSRTLGQPVLIDPRAGGGTMVASLFVKSQPPDGYTMYAASNSVTIKSVIPNAQIDIRKDFTPIIAPSISPMLILVNAEQVKATTMRELLAEARAKGGEMNYASYGIGSGAHMFMEMLLNENKVKMVHVPYQGTAQAAADTAGGRVQVTGTILASARPYLAEYGGSGKLRLIGQSLGERTPVLPNTPGMKESGFPDLDYGLWGGYIGPAGMSREVVATLNRAVNAALKDPAIVAHWTRLGQQIIGGTPEDLTRIINREYDGYTRLIRETGVKLE